MKINLFRIAIALTTCFFFAEVNAQSVPPCDFDNYVHHHVLQVNEANKNIFRHLPSANNSRSATLDTSVHVIPVVVHVIHNGGAENISDEQVKSQIRVLNEDFRKIAGTNGDGSGVDTKINFCLAQLTPDGKCTNGIVRIQSTLTNHQIYQRTQLGLLNQWDPARYLNIYVVKSINNGSGILGYSSFPGGPSNEDGVVVLYTAFGDTGAVISLSNLGRTATHELCHWFGLYHTFNNGCGTDTCFDGDFVCDTPPVANPNYGCAINNSCSNDFPDVNDLIQNYADYSNDACKSMFTAGQQERMMATLDSLRLNIWQPANITSTGCDSGFVSSQCIVIADFISNSQQICAGNPVLFTNKSLNNPLTYQWIFPGGNPSTSATANQTVTYNSAGVYDVTLIATNAFGTDTIIFPAYITVTVPAAGISLPYTEKFESSIFPPNGITIDNPDNGITWERDTAAVPFEGSGSIKINNLINTNYGQSDAFLLPSFDLTIFSGTPYLTFKYAYARSDANYSDELIVLISTDCVVNFTQIFYKTGSALATGPTQITPYIPDTNTVWKSGTVSLLSYASSTHAIIRFVNVTDGGNNLYVDNINVGSITASVNEMTDEFAINIFPQPAQDFFMVRTGENMELKSNSIIIYNQLGEIISCEKINSHIQKIERNKLPDGMYFFKVMNDEKIISTGKIIFD